jgi:hypothetical protein
MTAYDPTKTFQVTAWRSDRGAGLNQTEPTFRIQLSSPELMKALGYSAA